MVYADVNLWCERYLASITIVHVLLVLIVYSGISLLTSVYSNWRCISADVILLVQEDIS